jgi:hypothetical protein
MTKLIAKARTADLGYYAAAAALVLYALAFAGNAASLIAA